MWQTLLGQKCGYVVLTSLFWMILYCRLFLYFSTRNKWCDQSGPSKAVPVQSAIAADPRSRLIVNWQVTRVVVLPSSGRRWSRAWVSAGTGEDANRHASRQGRRKGGTGGGADTSRGPESVGAPEVVAVGVLMLPK